MRAPVIAGGVAVAIIWLALGTAEAESRRRDRDVDLSFHQAEIAEVLRFFADVSGVNIVCDEEVSGRVSLTLRGVRALRVALLTVGLDMEWVGEVIHVATAETIAARRQARVDDRQTCLETGPLRTSVIRLSHARAEDMLPLVRATLTERGRVVVDRRTNSLVVRDVDCP
jgi:type IV pilus assembly protein PilQ